MSELSMQELETLRGFPTPAVSNAIETFDVRPRNQGFMAPQIQQVFRGKPAVIGYAVTGRIVCAHDLGPRPKTDGFAWWDHVAAAVGPKLLVLEDLDRPTIGTWFGEVNSSIHMALGCRALVTNGAVRDLREVESMGFQYWAAAVAVSHGYSHMVDYNGTVVVGGLAVSPGDLLLADEHGVLSIPIEIAREIPAAVAKIERHERRIIDYCRGEGFSLGGLKGIVQSGVRH